MAKQKPPQQQLLFTTLSSSVLLVLCFCVSQQIGAVVSEHPLLRVGREDDRVTDSSKIPSWPENCFALRAGVWQCATGSDGAELESSLLVSTAPLHLASLFETKLPKHLTNPVSPHGQGQLFNKADINHHRLHISPRCYRRARSAVAFCIITQELPAVGAKNCAELRPVTALCVSYDNLLPGNSLHWG